VRYVDVGGSFEAVFDGVNRVSVRQKGTGGPTFNLTRRCVLDLLGLFPPVGSCRDELVVFEVFEGDKCCGSVALCLLWSGNDVLTELRSKGYPLDGEDGCMAEFTRWPPRDGEFSLKWGGTAFRFRARGCGGSISWGYEKSPGRGST
jgi:hypothetical protein